MQFMALYIKIGNYQLAMYDSYNYIIQLIIILLLTSCQQLILVLTGTSTRLSNYIFLCYVSSFCWYYKNNVASYSTAGKLGNGVIYNMLSICVCTTNQLATEFIKNDMEFILLCVKVYIHYSIFSLSHIIQQYLYSCMLLEQMSILTSPNVLTLLLQYLDLIYLSGNIKRTFGKTSLPVIILYCCITILTNQVCFTQICSY